MKDKCTRRKTKMLMMKMGMTPANKLPIGYTDRMLTPLDGGEAEDQNEQLSIDPNPLFALI